MEKKKNAIEDTQVQTPLQVLQAGISFKQRG